MKSMERLEEMHRFEEAARRGSWTEREWVGKPSIQLARN